MTGEISPSEMAHGGSLDRRLLDALHAAQVRREQSRRRQEQRKSRWLSSLSKPELDRHHSSETQSDA
jgi:hypothetical protein